jgi:UDP:flavonoid glycosyltransferase YjiC (YdhE family)
MPAHRIALATFGSFGDLHPFLAIACELKRRGHHPIVATIPLYQEKVEAAGFEFRPLRTASMELPDRELMRKALHPRTGPEFIVRKLVMPSLALAYADALTAFDDVSLVIVHPLAFAARLAAETMRIPWVATQLAPMGFISAYDPPVLPGAAFLNRLRPLGPAFFRPLLAVAKIAVRPWTRSYERFRAQLGLPPAPDPLFDGAYSPSLVLALFSSVLGAKMPDWPQQTVVTGFPCYDGEDAALPPALEDFLDAGDAPIVFTLGTSAVHDAGSFYQESAKAAQSLGMRAVLLVGRDAANIPPGLPATILPVGYASFTLLFPRSAAIVHQGGVGTTGQAMRAGKPMLVMPYAVDQPDNAERVRRLGIARVLTRGNYSATTAARELGELLGDPQYRRNAAAIARQLKQEDGAAVACDLLERYLERYLAGPTLQPHAQPAATEIPIALSGAHRLEL